MSGEPTGLRGDPTRAQVRGSTLLLVGQAFALVAGLAVQVLIVRVLSKAEYGAFAYALSLAMLAEAVTSFGLRRGVSRFMPTYEERGEDAKALGTLVFAFCTILSLGLVTMLALIGLRHMLTGSFPSPAHAAAVLLIMSALTPAQALANLLDGVFAVYVRPGAIVVRKYVLTPLLRLVVVALLALESHDVRFLAAGYVLTAIVGLAVYGTMLVPVLRDRGLWDRLRTRRLQMPVGEVLRFTVPLLSTDVTRALLGGGNAVLLGIMATPGDVAELRAVVPVSLTMTYVLSAFGILFVPLAARLHARGELADLNRLYWQTAIWTAVLSFPVFITCTGLAGPLTRLLFGERYAHAAPLLAVLAVGHFVTAAAGPNGVLLGVLGRVRYVVFANLGAIVASVALNVALIPPLGALGAALATAATFVGLNAALQAGLGRDTGVHVLDPTYASAYLALAAVSAIALALLLLGSLPLLVEIAVAVLATVATLGFARRRLGVAETFPELARLPGVRLLLAAGRR